MNEVFDKTIQTTDAAGSPLTWELLISTYERMDFYFNEQGEWEPPMLVAHPYMMPHFKKIFAEAEADPIKIQQWREVIDRKRREFYAKEADRKLVD